MLGRTDIPSLTSVRGLAAATVLFSHVIAVFLGRDAVPPVLLRGYLAVDLFFLLSGFVLAHVYARELADHLSLGAWGRFLWARLARIYPVHLFLLVMMLPLLGWTADLSRSTLAINLLLLQGPWLPWETWNNFSWSISAEWHAYLVFPILATLLWRSGRITAAVVAVSCAGLATMAVFLGHGRLAHVTNGPEVLARSIPEFVIGMLFYKLYSIDRVRVLFRADALALITIAAIVLVTAGASTDLPILPLLAMLTIIGASNEGWIRRLLTVRPLLYLGNISYSLYMVQYGTILTTLIILWLYNGGPLVSWRVRALGLILGVAMTFAMAAAVSRYIEYPARKQLRQFFERKPRDVVLAP